LKSFGRKNDLNLFFWLIDPNLMIMLVHVIYKPKRFFFVKYIVFLNTNIQKHAIPLFNFKVIVYSRIVSQSLFYF
jgi:hypothetical protein